MKMKNILKIFCSAVLCGIMFMNLSIGSNLNEFQTESINLSNIAKTAIAEEEGCVGAPTDCVMLWYKCVDGDCWYEEVIFYGFEPIT